jgi:hypothetical protein
MVTIGVTGLSVALGTGVKVAVGVVGVFVGGSGGGSTRVTGASAVKPILSPAITLCSPTAAQPRRTNTSRSK